MMTRFPIRERESVRAHIEAQRPVTAELFVPPTVAKPVAYVISNLEPDTAEIRAAVVAELRTCTSATRYRWHAAYPYVGSNLDRYG